MSLRFLLIAHILLNQEISAAEPNLNLFSDGCLSTNLATSNGGLKEQFRDRVFRFISTQEKSRSDEFLSKRYLVTENGKSYNNANEGIAKLKEIGFESLAFDVGILTRVEDFLKFVKENNLESKDPWFVRAKYREFLGYVVRYRALALKPQDAERIQKQGILSPLLVDSETNLGFSPEKISNLAIERFQKNVLSNEVKQKLIEEPGHRSALLSVTSNPEVAIFAANLSMRDPTNGFRFKDKDIYLFELRLPKLSIVEMGQSNSVVPYPSEARGTGKSWMERFKNHETFKITLRTKDGYKSTDVPINSDLESFIYLSIEPGEISSVSRVELD